MPSDLSLGLHTSAGSCVGPKLTQNFDFLQKQTNKQKSGTERYQPCSSHLALETPVRLLNILMLSQLPRSIK